MRSPIILGALVALLTPAGALAQRADLPPSAKVAEALDNHPAVAAARAREDAARADRDMLAKGTNEIAVTGSSVQIGRAHVVTPVTNAHLVCLLMLDKNMTNHT